MGRAMPQPSKKERGFQTSLCKQGAGIARETIAMAMAEGLEKQLSPPEKKLPVLKRFCPWPVAKCPPATSECQHRACLAACPSPVPSCQGPQWTCSPMHRHQPGTATPWKRGGTATLLGPLSTPQPSPAPGCCPRQDPGAGCTPLGRSYLPVRVHSGEEDIRVLLGREGAVRDRGISPLPLLLAAPSSHPTQEAPGHHKHPLPGAYTITPNQNLCSPMHAHQYQHICTHMRTEYQHTCTNVYPIPAYRPPNSHLSPCILAPKCRSQSQRGHWTHQLGILAPQQRLLLGEAQLMQPCHGHLLQQ